MTSLIGRLADKANIVKSAFSELEKAVIKATRHNLKGPKEKHVRRLIVSTFEQPGKNQEIIGLLGKRLELLDWIVVMKTLEVFHRLLKDGNAQFINDLKYHSAKFNLRNFKDITTPEAHYQSIFIQKYSQYLEEKVLVFKMLNIEFEKDPNVVKTFTVDEAFEKIPRLQSQLNALLNCRASKSHINNGIIVYGFTLLLKDSFKLYRSLNDAIINVLEHYFTMSKANAQKALDIYKLFTKETDAIIQFFDITRKFSKTDLPELQHAPTTLVEALENYLKEVDDGKGTSAPSQNNNERGKNLAKQMDLFSFDDTKFNDAHNPEDSDSDDEKHGHKTDDFGFGGPTTHPQTAQRNPSQGSVQPQPTFDPFFEDTAKSSDNLPTFSTSNNTNNFFDDPFGGPIPTQPQQQQQNNQGVFVDKKKNIEAVMASSTGQKPMTPQNNNSFGNQQPNNNMGFQQQPNSGFGQQQNNMGFQQPNNMGFGQTNMGFQQPNNNMGFGQQQQNNMGFGQPNNNMGFGQQNPGFGQQNNMGFGQQPNNNMGFGFQQQQPNNNMGFGQQQNNGFAQNNQSNNPFLNPTPVNNTQQNNSLDFNPFA